MRPSALPSLVLLAGAALAGAALAGCDSAGPDAFEPEVVVSAVLVVGQPMPEVDLSLTGPIGEPYDPNERAVEGATLTIALLEADGSVDTTVVYEDRGRGDYRAVGPDVPVLEGRRYRLDAAVPGFDAPISAETIVPQAFEVVRPPPPSVVYQAGDAPTLDVTPSGVGGAPAVYVLTFTALDPSPETLTPFAADLVFTRDVAVEDLVTASSPLVNEDNYQRNDDGSLRIELPWFAFNFYGPVRVSIAALDPALVTFLQYQAIQTIPTTISPGEIPAVVTNVRNGLGVFGAVALAEVELVVERPQ